MPEEVGFILKNLRSVKSIKYGDLELFSGEWLNDYNKQIFLTVAWSGWGKVSAARATTRLISSRHNNIPIEMILFTGVAGAVNDKLKQWDVVLSEAVIQHDMDARPIFDRYVVPAINNSKIFSNKKILKKIYPLLEEKLKQTNPKIFGKLYKGLIATGDMFISDRKKIKKLANDIPGILAVEMEGAAFAQVAFQENLDWIVLRVISDGGNESAHDEFNHFLEKYKSKSFDLIKYFLDSLLMN